MSCAWCGDGLAGFCCPACAEASREHNEDVEQRNAEQDGDQYHRVRGNNHDRDLEFISERLGRTCT